VAEIKQQFAQNARDIAVCVALSLMYSVYLTALSWSYTKQLGFATLVPPLH
jgi:hypothetical protein